MITIKVNVLKIKKEHLFKGEKGTYLDLVLFDKPNEYGDSGYVRQGISKEAREAGESGEICGNWRDLQPKEPAKPKQNWTKPKPVVADDDIPF